ncbi:MAG: DUF192 domain-containing protein [Dehalococcoidia bacterium]
MIHLAYGLRRGTVLVLLFSTLLTAACRTKTQGPPTASPTIQADPRLPVIVFTSAFGGRASFGVEIEANDAQREHGLMNVRSLPADQGQIFVFQDVAPNQDVLVSFWMHDTLVPLSIAFISGDGHVQEIQDMAPESDTIHTPQRPYRYAIEANQGWYARHGVQAGSAVDLSAVTKGG